MKLFEGKVFAKYLDNYLSCKTIWSPSKLFFEYVGRRIRILSKMERHLFAKQIVFRRAAVLINIFFFF